MGFKRTAELRRKAREWVGRRVLYWLPTLYADGRLDGPYTGTVTGVSDNQALVEDELEGNTHDNSVEYTGQLLVVPDGTSQGEYVLEDRCKIINEP